MKLKTKIPYIILSLFISLMLWFYMVGIQQPEKEEMISGIKVVFEGEEELYEDRGLLISSVSTPTISLLVRGNMIDLSRLKTRKDEILVTVDLSLIRSAGESQLAYDVESIPVEGVNVLERSPFYITLLVDKVETNLVEIMIKNEGTIAEGYLRDEPVITPENLQVSGSEEKIASIAYAEVVWTRENQEKTLQEELEYTFRDENGKVISKDGLTANYDFVTVKFPVKKLKDLPVVVDVVEGGGAKRENINFDIVPSFITVAGDPEIVDTLNFVTVDTPLELAKIISPGVIKKKLIIPNDVVNVSGETTCDITINAIVGLATREYVCENITVANLPKGLSAEITTTQLNVRLRGKEETLDLIYGHNLRAVANLEDEALAEGRYSVKVDVYLDGYSDVGVVGEYRIVIDVKAEGS